MKIDYTALRPPDVLGAFLDPVAASVSRFAEHAAAKKKQERELAFRREQEGRLMAANESKFNQAMARQKSIDARDAAVIERDRQKQELNERKFQGGQEVAYDKMGHQTELQDKRLKTGVDMQDTRLGAQATRQDDQQEFLGGQGDLNRAAAMDRERVKAASPGRGRNSDERLEVSRLSHVNGELQRLQKQFDIAPDRKERARLNTFIDNNENPVVQRAMVYNALTRGLAGEKGPLSDTDVARVSGQLRGKLGDIENWASIYSSGKMAPDQEKLVTDTVRLVLKESNAREAQAKSAFEATFSAPTSPYQRWGFGEHIQNRRREIFGDEEPIADAVAPAGPSASPDDINSEAALPEDPQAQSIDDMQPTAAPQRRQAIPVEAGGAVGLAVPRKKSATTQSAKPTREQLIEEIRRRRGAR